MSDVTRILESLARGERASAEAHRITDLIHAEVYGQGERDGTE